MCGFVGLTGNFTTEAYCFRFRSNFIFRDIFFGELGLRVCVAQLLVVVWLLLWVPANIFFARVPLMLDLEVFFPSHLPSLGEFYTFLLVFTFKQVVVVVVVVALKWVVWQMSRKMW